MQPCEYTCLVSDELPVGGLQDLNIVSTQPSTTRCELLLALAMLNLHINIAKSNTVASTGSFTSSPPQLLYTDITLLTELYTGSTSNTHTCSADRFRAKELRASEDKLQSSLQRHTQHRPRYTQSRQLQNVI